MASFLLGNVISNTGNVGNVRMVGGNIAVSGQINTLGNVVSSFLLGNVISNTGNIGNVRMVGGNIAVSGQINTLGNVVAPFHLGNVIGDFANIGNVRIVGGNVSVSGQVNVSGQVVALGNIWASFFRGNGALLEGVIPSGVQNLDIRGNLIGDYANVITGNIGNTRFVGGNVEVSGQINTRGNVVAPFLIGDIRGNIVGDYANVITGNIGNVRIVGGNVAVSGQVNVSGQIVALGNVWAPFFRGNGALLEGVVPSGVQNLDIRGNLIGDYANVITGNIGNVRFVGGNVEVSGQVNVSGQIVALGNIWAPFFRGNGALLEGVGVSGVQSLDIRGNVIGDYANVIIGNIGNTRFVGGNVAVSGQINTLGNVVAPFFLGNVIGNFGNIGNVRMEAGNITISGNINMTRQLRWTSVPGPMMEYYVFAGGRAGLGQFGDTTRLYPYIAESLILGQYSTEVGTQASDYIVANSSQGVHIHRSTTFKNIQNGGTMTVSVLGNLNVIGNIASTENLKANTGNILGSFSVGSDGIGNLSVEDTIIPKRGIRYSGGQYVNYMLEYANDVGTENERRTGVGMSGETMRLYAPTNVSGTAIIIGGNYSPLSVPVSTDFMSFDQSNGNIHVFKDTSFMALDGSDCNVSVSGQVSANNIVVGQINATGNVVSEYYFGNVAFASGISEASIPNTIFADVTGNLAGEYANVIWGNIGNTRFMGGNVAVSGQINTLGNVVAPFFLGNVIGDFANIGNTRMVGGNVAVSGQINVLGNIVAPFFLGNVIGDIQGNIIGDIRGNVIGDYANVIIGNIGNTRFVGGNVEVSGQINTLGNVVASKFIGDIHGNLIGDYANVIVGNIGNTRFVGGNVAISGQINVLGNIVAPIFLGNVIGNFGNIGNVRMEAGNILANSANIANVRLDASNVTAQYYLGNGALLTGLVESSRYLSVGRTTDQTRPGSSWANAAVIMDRILVNSGITYNSTTGVVTLEGGITYRVTAQLGWSLFGGYICGFRMVESVSQVQVGPGAAEVFGMSITGVNNPPAPVLDFLITPTVTTTYQLRTTQASNAGAAEDIRADVGTWMNIVSVSSKPIVSQGGWTKVTDWNFGASTTAPTSATSATRHYVWSLTGKMMSIKGFYNQTATTGASAGSGEYLFAMPGGYRIDTTTTGLATVGDVLEIPIGQTTLSTGTGNRSSGVVLAYDSGNIKFANWSVGGLSANITTIGSAFLPLTSSALYSLYFTADIPIV